MNFQHLDAELKQLSEMAQQIRDSGLVAPDHCWIETYSVKRNGKQHDYKRLASDRPQFGEESKSRTLHLGKAGSEKHQDWVLRLKRRDSLTEIERRMHLVRQLMERENKFPIWNPEQSILEHQPLRDHPPVLEHQPC